MIALGRVMLCVMFLIAVSLQREETAASATDTFALLAIYGAAAIAVTALTWRNWWLEARLAVPMHLLDMGVFTAIVFSTNSSTTPFFLFFVLPLLSAAIRWSWRETALTATALILLFMCAGWLVAGHGSFELERFVVRSGHLLILSLLLIWFGIHQRVGPFLAIQDIESRLGKPDSPLGRALTLAMEVTKAGGGAILVAPTGEEALEGVTIGGEKHHAISLDRPLVRRSGWSAFLYDAARDHALSRPPQGRFQFESASELLDLEAAHQLPLTQGLVAEVRTGTCQGWLVLWGIPDLSSDFIEFGRELGRAAGAIVDRHALLEAMENGAAARTRLSLARDVHDSIVQFLAGAAFRVEAIKRGANSGASVGPDLEELKRLLVEEQGEIRGFLLALRSDRDLELADAVAELRALAERLSQQWSVNCNIIADSERGSIPIRMQLDLQQMLREAVANAVRHGGADRVDIGLEVEDDRLHMRVADNGVGFPKSDGAAAEPWSLKERVERAHGSIRLVSQPGLTNIHISLPLAGAAA